VNEELKPLISRILASHRSMFGNSLYNLPINDNDAAKTLHLAPYALLSHGLGKDPLFTYGNQTALRLFELTWEEMLLTPSRASAESGNQKAREEFMQNVIKNGYAKGYSGVRISSMGKKFKIIDASVWNILGKGGAIIGQAAAFMKWEDI
jgi:hypothetical protein